MLCENNSAVNVTNNAIYGTISTIQIKYNAIQYKAKQTMRDETTHCMALNVQYSTTQYNTIREDAVHGTTSIQKEIMGRKRRSVGVHCRQWSVLVEDSRRPMIQLMIQLEREELSLSLSMSAIKYNTIRYVPYDLLEICQ